MKKKLAAWLVLGLITVVAGLSLALTNEVTKEPIRNQAAQAEAKAKQKVLPEAESFEALELAEDADVELLAGKAGGAVVGYVGKVTVNGFGGPVDVIAGIDENGVVKGIDVGGASFSETAGLGAKSREPAFMDQFKDKVSPLRVVKASDPNKNDSSIDALTAATITSNAVVGGVNRIAKQISNMLHPEEAPAAAAEGTTYTASQQGFGGPVAVFVTVKDDGTISQLKVGDDQFAESEGYGANALSEDFTKQFIGKSLPLKADDIEAVSGASITTKAVLTAVNQAYEEKNVVADSGAEGTEYTAQKQGFGGPVAVRVWIKDDGTISQLTIGDDQFAESEGYGANALEPDFAKQFIGKSLPISLKDIEAVSGATITSTAVVDALNDAFEQSKAGGQESEPQAGDAPEETAAPAPMPDEADMKSASKQGFGGPVAVKVAFNEDGSIKALIIGDDDFNETPGLGAKAQEEVFISQFAGKMPPLSLRKADEEASASNIDGITGATVTSQAVIDAINEAAGAGEKTAEPEAAPDVTTTEATNEEATTVIKKGFGGPVAVKVAFNEDGSIKALTIGDDDFNETPGLGAKAQEEEFTSQFAGKMPPLSLRKADEEASASNIDGITGATVTSQAVVDAINEAAGAGEKTAEPEAAPDVTTTEATNEEATTVIKKGFGGPVAVSVIFSEDGSVKSLTIGDDDFNETPGLGAKAQEEEFTSQFAGKMPPLSLRKADEEASASNIDGITGATVTSQAVVDAINEAAGAGEKAAEPEAAPEATKEEATTVIKKGFGGPVAVSVIFSEDGSVKSLTIGDDDFNETPGLGAKAQEEEFISQFAGKMPPLSLRKADEEASASNIDGITGATVTSQAIVDAINEAAGAGEKMAEPEAAPEATKEEATTVIKKGFGGPVAVSVIFSGDGSVKSLTIGDDDFNETPGLGAKAQEEEFTSQFAGKMPPLSLRKVDEEASASNIDGITGATVTSQAVVDAVNEAFEQLGK